MTDAILFVYVAALLAAVPIDLDALTALSMLICTGGCGVRMMITATVDLA